MSKTKYNFISKCGAAHTTPLNLKLMNKCSLANNALNFNDKETGISKFIEC